MIDSSKFQVPSTLSGLEKEVEAIRDLVSDWRLLHLSVFATAERDVPVPYPGSLLRGAFGAALYRLVCVQRGTACGACPLVSRCPYPSLFEPQVRPGDKNSRFRGSPPPSLILKPPIRIRAGPFAFDVKLTAPGLDLLPHLVYALVQMGREGIGRERIPFSVYRIDSVSSSEQHGARCVFEEGEGVFPRNGVPFSGSVFFENLPPARLARLGITLKTPLRMKQSGRFRSGFSFERLVRAILRRLVAYGSVQGQEWPQSWEDLLTRARKVEISREETSWLDWGRYSRRQGRGMRLGGATGQLEYLDIPQPYLPLLKAAEFLHLGKNVSFGLGAIEVREFV